MLSLGLGPWFDEIKQSYKMKFRMLGFLTIYGLFTLCLAIYMHYYGNAFDTNNLVAAVLKTDVNEKTT